MCLCSVSFLESYRFKIIDPKSSPKLLKNQFLEKSDPLTEKFQNFAIKGFLRTLIHVFLPSFVEISKAEVTKQVVVFIPKKVGVGILSLCLGF